ncbi:MAG TPA: hypothetical protein VME70_14425 [Mycobacteriales bacterium]|nr:hypothetical protein [Mycobacteriales bacterium]
MTGRTAAGALFAAVMVIVVVSVDVLFFRHHFWARLAVNVGIVVVAAVLYLLFVHRR